MSTKANTVLIEPQSSIIPHIILYVSQIIALALPPFRGRREVFSILILGLAVYVYANPHFTNNVSLAQPFTIAWSYYMATLAKLLCSKVPGPEGSYWRIDRKAKEALLYKSLGRKKILWAAVLIFNQRGIRWNFQVKNVPQSPPHETRRNFLLRQLFQFLKCLCIADLLFEVGTRLFFTSTDGTVGNMDSKYLTLRHPDWRWDFGKCLVFGATPYFMLSMQYAQFAFVAVFLNLSKPEDWPSPFGKLAHTTTIRDFWGRYWHQQLRHMLTLYTDSLADLLRIQRGTNLSSYTKLYLAFAISGMFHALSQLQMPCPTNITPSERCWGFFLFFVWQTVAITLEDCVQWLYKKAGGKFEDVRGRTLRTAAGYCWVIGSMWLSIPLVGDTFLRMRMGVDSLLPFSIARPLVQKYIPIPT
ncbi:toxin biosynthesis protein [Amylocarpus encephaloides]|uniref:Toxin biosynthesis protein n=1 Tax=Amylocarpus encephaloides TaxID=45428 RepID=A0A9P7YBZ9_9HELO|nr:toxin biosynthesis protein [Amylocarpus encephaloides]